MLTEAQKSVRSEFDRLINMSAEEMTTHFASEASDFASLDPKIAAKLKMKSGKTLGKKALSLKVKEAWEDPDYDEATSILRSLKWQLGRKASYAKEDGSPTVYAISLMNRGHNPLKEMASVAEAEKSLREFESEVNKAVRHHFMDMFGGEFPDGVYSPWVKDIFPRASYAIIDWEDSLWQVNFTVSENGDVTVVPGIVEMTTTYVPKTEIAIEQPGDVVQGTLIEVAEAVSDEEGPKWIGAMIRAGSAKNTAPNGQPYYYPAEVLETAVTEGLFDSVPGFQRTDEEHINEEGDEKAGTWGKASWDAVTQRVKNAFTWLKDKYPSVVHTSLKKAIAEGKKEVLPGFSITGDVMVSKAQPNIVQKIIKIRSCDPISFPSAGGEIIAITESHIKETKMKIKVTEALKAKGLIVPKKLEKLWETVQVAEGAAAEWMLAQLKEKRPKLFEKMTELEGKLTKDEVMLVTLFSEFMEAEGIETVEPSTGDDAAAVAAAEARRIAESDRAMLAVLQEQALEGILRDSGLNDIEKGTVRSRFKGQQFDMVKIQESIREAKDRQEAYGKTVPPKTRIDVQRDGLDKIQQAANDLFFSDIDEVSVRESVNTTAGNPVISKHQKGSQRSLRGLYIMLTGDSDLTFDIAKVRESIDPATIAKIFANALNLRLTREDSLPSVYDGWRLIADVVPLADFKKQEVMRTGYYGTLSIIQKNDPYPELAQGTKLDNSYTPDTRGGLVSIHRKDIINDNVGEIRRIPSKINIGAKLDLSGFVWSLILDNPTLGDTTALFHADHGNLHTGNTSTAGLSGDILSTLDGKMKDQTLPGRTEKLLLPTKYVIIPANAAMRKKAYEVVAPAYGQNNQVPTFAQSLTVQVIECPHASDADDWYTATDKNIQEILEVGFFQGREEPELLIADNDLAGALFTHDKIQYKVRHEYGGSVVDYRGLQKSAVT